MPHSFKIIPGSILSSGYYRYGVLHVLPIPMWVSSHLPETSQEVQLANLNGCKCVSVCVWCPVMDWSQDQLWIHHDPDQNKAITESDWLSWIALLHGVVWEAKVWWLSCLVNWGRGASGFESVIGLRDTVWCLSSKQQQHLSGNITLHLGVNTVLTNFFNSGSDFHFSGLQISSAHWQNTACLVLCLFLTSVQQTWWKAFQCFSLKWQTAPLMFGYMFMLFSIQGCLSNLLSNTKTLKHILEEMASVLKIFWRAALPSAETTTPEHQKVDS